MSPALRIGAAGFGLIAVCYGFARFAFGLFLPYIDAELHLGPALSGVISGGAFAGYCLAIVISALLAERIGPRAVACAAAVTATLGMAGIVLAPSAPWLAGAVIIAGSSAGLASPPMAAAVAVAVATPRQDATNTFINAGTSAGVALSGPVAFALAGQWRMAFLLFTVIAALLSLAVMRTIPPGRYGATAGSLPPINGPVLRLIAATFLMGAGSTAIWSFGGTFAVTRLGWGATGTGVLWIMIGLGGLAGSGAGTLVNRFGLASVHWTFLLLMAAGLCAVGAPYVPSAFVLPGGALFGAAYITLTGLYLIWGLRAVPDRPATGLMTGFLSLAIGQTSGAPVFGFLMANLGAGTAVIAFAALALSAGLFSVARFDFTRAGRGVARPPSAHCRSS